MLGDLEGQITEVLIEVLPQAVLFVFGADELLKEAGFIPRSA